MRIPKLDNYKNDKKILQLTINKVNPIEKQYIILNDKDKIKLIKTVESIVRKSLEYKQFITFLRNEVDMTSCSFYNNVTTNNRRSKISIEIHHCPFTLFDIATVVVNKYIECDLDPDPLAIAEEVMSLHYKNMVGLIPLSTTVHQLVHDGKLFIPLQCVFGNYISFLKEYEPFITQDLQEMLKAELKMSKELNSLDMSILETKYTYITVDGFKLPQLISTNEE